MLNGTAYISIRLLPVPPLSFSSGKLFGSAIHVCSLPNHGAFDVLDVADAAEVGGAVGAAAGVWPVIGAPPVMPFVVGCVAWSGPKVFFGAAASFGDRHHAAAGLELADDAVISGRYFFTTHRPGDRLSDGANNDRSRRDCRRASGFGRGAPHLQSQEETV
jgi:hypothetical protein